MSFLPDLLTFNDGGPVKSASDMIRRKSEILELLSKYEYGYIPEKPYHLTGTVKEKSSTAAGHAVSELIELSFDTDAGEFTFPLKFTYPSDGRPHPAFVFINFSSDIYDKYCPLEEIVDNGFAVASIYYEDITSDDDNFDDKLAGMFRRKEDGTDYGKISLWAYACSRAADYLESRKECDFENLAVIGHSRLGKTALWCGANDERFRFVISNCSGCGGAAYEAEKHGNAETYPVILKNFPYWFCENFKDTAFGKNGIVIDQHLLLSLSAPRYLCVGSASLDEWADPYSEQMSAVEASSAWSAFGMTGYSGKTERFKAGDFASDGDIHYHLRDGAHFLSRSDWNYYMKFIKNKLTSDLRRI